LLSFHFDLFLIVNNKLSSQHSDELIAFVFFSLIFKNDYGTKQKYFDLLICFFAQEH